MTRTPTTRWRRLAWVAAATLALVSCGSEKEASAPPPTTAPPPPSGPPGSPLTGLPVDPTRAARPVLVVKIDNAPKARPQVGINQAEVVFEEAVEGGVTRFAALFHTSEAGDVGPVRSARSTDILLATPFNRPLFAYSGANEDFQRQIEGSALVNVGVDRFPGDYRRQRGRPMPYNQFSSTAKLRAHASPGAGPPPPLFKFRAPGEALGEDGASPARQVSIEYRGRILTAVQYRWDAGSGTWRRTQDGGPHVDASGVQVAPRNVVVQFVVYRDTGHRDQSGEPVPEGELVGEGEAWVFTDGKVVRGRWRKPSREAVTEYLHESGGPVRLTPGPTWVEMPHPGKAGIG